MTKKTYYIPVIAVMAILACCFIISSYYQSRIDKIKNMYENKLATAGFRIIYDVDEDVDILLKRTADESADILILSREQAIEAGEKVSSLISGDRLVFFLDMDSNEVEACTSVTLNIRPVPNNSDVRLGSGIMLIDEGMYVYMEYVLTSITQDMTPSEIHWRRSLRSSVDVKDSIADFYLDIIENPI